MSISKCTYVKLNKRAQNSSIERLVTKKKKKKKKKEIHHIHNNPSCPQTNLIN